MDKIFKISLAGDLYLIPILNTNGDLSFYKIKDQLCLSTIDLNINKDNKLTIEETITDFAFDNERIINEIKRSTDILNIAENNKLKLHTKPNTLEDKTYKELVKDIIKSRDKDEDADDEENYDPERFYEENYELEQEIDYEDTNYYYENLFDEEYCIFQLLKETKNVLLNRCDEDEERLVALYDVLLYSGNEKNKHMMFRSVLKNTDPFYRIIVNEYNEIVFKIIADKTIKYKFEIDDKYLKLVEI
jgi:hypothetical protein